MKKGQEDLARKRLTELGEIQFFSFTDDARLAGYRVGTSDEPLVRSIFGQQEYNLDGAFQTPPSFIVDAGANVGYASLYFARKYPAVQILAIEPDAKNFAMLKFNTEDYPQITCLRAGLWGRTGSLAVKDVGLGDWGMMTEEATGESETDVLAISIPDILQQVGLEEIDLLKMDVEGAEKEIFSAADLSWVPRVRCLVCELHDRMKMGCSQAVFSAISLYSYAFAMRGENCIFLRQGTLSEAQASAKKFAVQHLEEAENREETAQAGSPSVVEKTPEISVIVPVYNVAPYLAQCMESIYAQDFRDFELIMIDDGSTDESGQIADELAARGRGSYISRAIAGPLMRATTAGCSRGDAISPLSTAMTG